eukprot:SAG31_NODE_391_length_16344_cov_15.753339_8_plen_71_part_00
MVRVAAAARARSAVAAAVGVVASALAPPAAASARGPAGPHESHGSSLRPRVWFSRSHRTSSSPRRMHSDR